MSFRCFRWCLPVTWHLWWWLWRLDSPQANLSSGGAASKELSLSLQQAPPVEVSINGGTPKWMAWKIPSKWMIWGYPNFRKLLELSQSVFLFSRAHLSQVEELQDQGGLALLQCEFCSADFCHRWASEGKRHAMWYLDYEVRCQAAALLGFEFSPETRLRSHHVSPVFWKKEVSPQHLL